MAYHSFIALQSMQWTTEEITMNKATKTIKQDTIALLTRKRALTYEGVVKEIQKRHPEAKTSVKTVQWYASRLRAAGEEVNVKLLNDRKATAPKGASH